MPRSARSSVAHQPSDTCRRSPDGAQEAAGATGYEFLYWLKRAFGTRRASGLAIGSVARPVARDECGDECLSKPHPQDQPSATSDRDVHRSGWPLPTGPKGFRGFGLRSPGGRPFLVCANPGRTRFAPSTFPLGAQRRERIAFGVIAGVDGCDTVDWRG